MKTLIATLLILCATAAQAQIYKCTEGGKTVFTDQPCDDAAKPFSTAPASGYYQSSGSQAADETPSQSAAGDKGLDDLVSTADRLAKQRGITNEIEYKERKIRDAESRRDSELSALKAKQWRANNNLAGSTWLQSIAQEMTAVTARYDAEIQVLRSDIDRLRRDHAALN